MKFVVTGPNGKQVTLGDDSVGDYINLEEPAKESLVDNTPLPRAKTPLLIDRGNAVGVFPFTVTRTFQSRWASLSFFLQHMMDVPNAGDVLVLHGDSGGSGELLMPGAMIKVQPKKLTGISNIIHYTLTGPGFGSSQ